MKKFWNFTSLYVPPIIQIGGLLLFITLMIADPDLTWKAGILFLALGCLVLGIFIRGFAEKKVKDHETNLDRAIVRFFAGTSAIVEEDGDRTIWFIGLLLIMFGGTSITWKLELPGAMPFLVVIGVMLGWSGAVYIAHKTAQKWAQR